LSIESEDYKPNIDFNEIKDNKKINTSAANQKSLDISLNDSVKVISE
jgi:hypothetical protein